MIKKILFLVFCIMFTNNSVCYADNNDIWSAIKDGKYDITKNLVKDLTVEDTNNILSQKDKNSNIPNFNNEFFTRIAMFNNNIDVLNAVIDIGVDINYKSGSREYTVLIHASRYNENIEIIKRLIEAGADPQVKAANMATPLAVAIYNDNPQIMKLFIKKGLDINAKDKYEDTPFIEIVETSSNIERLGEIIKLGADINAKGYEGRTALRNNFV